MLHVYDLLLGTTTEMCQILLLPLSLSVSLSLKQTHTHRPMQAQTLSQSLEGLGDGNKGLRPCDTQLMKNQSYKRQNISVLLGFFLFLFFVKLSATALQLVN